MAVRYPELLQGEDTSADCVHTHGHRPYKGNEGRP